MLERAPSAPEQRPVVAVARDHVALQLALTGVHTEQVSDTEAAEEVVSHYLDQPVEVLIVQEELRAGFSHALRDKLERHRRAPLVVFCPSFDEGEAEVDAYLTAVLKPIIGYEMRLE